MRFSLLLALFHLHFTSSAMAVMDLIAHRSPDGKYQINNMGNTATASQYFELRRSDGHVLFSSDQWKDFEVPSFAEDILWSKSGDHVAVSISTSKYLIATLVISTKTGVVFQIPTEDSDHQTRPVRWTKIGELVVETIAPIGGKADADSTWNTYRYRRTFRLRAHGTKAECVYTGSLVYPCRAQLLKDGYKPQ